jgi:tetratricopeptide (TPR) repeat protein
VTGLAIVFIFLFIKRDIKWGRPLLLVSVFFSTTLFPMLGFFNMYIARYAYVADHFPYLASLGPIILAGYGISRLVETVPAGKFPMRNIIPLSLLLLFGILTNMQSRIYKNTETLWRDTIGKNPTCWLAYNNLGELLAREGKMQEAFTCFTRAYDLKNDYEAACYNLGTFALRQGDYEKAVIYLEKAIHANWNYPEAHNNLGNALSKQGRMEDAIASYGEALSLRPDYMDACFNLGNTFFRMENLNAAEVNYKKALEISPYHPDIHCNLGVVLIQMGEKEEGAFHLKEAISIAPDHAVANQALESLGR